MEEDVLHKQYDSRLMRRLLHYALPYWKWIVAALLLLVVNSAGQILGPLLTKLAVDRYLVPPETPVSTPIDPYLSADPATGIAQIAAIYLLATVIGMVASFGQAYLMQRTGQFAMFDLRRKLIAHLHDVDLAYYDKNPVGRILTRVTTDVDALNELFSSGLVAILGDVLVILFLVLAMLKMSTGMTLLLLAVMPLVVLVTYRFRNAAQASYRRVRVAVARINAFLQEHLSGMAVVQLFNHEAASRAAFDEGNAEHRDAYKESILAYGWFYPVVEFLGMLALASLLAFGGWRIQQGALTLGALVAFFQYGMRFFRPIQDLSEKYNIIQGAMAAGERVFQLLDTPAAVKVAAQPAQFPALPAPIEFDHVWFAYQGEDWVLRDLTLRIEPGETLAVVGHTGAGKTTLTSLLMRFYDVQKGAIRLGGVDIRDLEPRVLRSHFGVVLQDPFLFSSDIAGNIRLGSEGIDDTQVEEAAQRVNLAAFVDSLPNRYATEVRERGAGLSTGQKQLISFARALAHNPAFLVLDEATSSVDTETEIRVREALTELLKNRTSIVIAHRLSTIQRADRILVLHKGEMREIGSHQELLASRGIYWKLYQLQYKDQERTAILQ